MPSGGQVVDGCPKRVVVDIGEHHGSAGLGEGLGSRSAHPRTRSGDKGDLPLEVIGGVHGASGAAAYSSSVTWRPHTTGLPVSSASWTARWVMKRSGAAPCQWSSPGSK